MSQDTLSRIGEPDLPLVTFSSLLVSSNANHAGSIALIFGVSCFVAVVNISDRLGKNNNLVSSENTA